MKIARINKKNNKRREGKERKTLNKKNVPFVCQRTMC
jgi:hypothetical protein